MCVSMPVRDDSPNPCKALGNEEHVNNKINRRRWSFCVSLNSMTSRLQSAALYQSSHLCSWRRHGSSRKAQKESPTPDPIPIQIKIAKGRMREEGRGEGEGPHGSFLPLSGVRSLARSAALGGCTSSCRASHLPASFARQGSSQSQTLEGPSYPAVGWAAFVTTRS